MSLNHIICVGAVYIDTILTIPHFPIEDEKLSASGISKRRGGNTANTLEVLRQLVHHQRNTSTSPLTTTLATTTTTQSSPPSSTSSLHLLSILPCQSSPATEFIRTSLPKVEIDHTSIFHPEHQDAASSYILHNTATHSRTIVSLNQIPELTFRQFKDKVLSHGIEWKAAWFHFEGRIPDVVRECVVWLREWSAEVRVSLECEKPEREGLEAVVGLVDVVFYSKLWATKKGFVSARQFLEAKSEEKGREQRICCCTWGAGGVCAVKKGGGGVEEWADVRAWHPEGSDGTGEAEREVVDTIGAGDTFIAGMLFALNHRGEWTLKQSLEFSNELSGRKVIQEGFEGLGEKML